MKHLCGDYKILVEPQLSDYLMTLGKARVIVDTSDFVSQ